MNVIVHYQFVIKMQNVQIRKDLILVSAKMDFLEMGKLTALISMNVYPNLASAIGSLLAAMLQGPIHVIVEQDFLGKAH